jgi:mevalonate kinase
MSEGRAPGKVLLLGEHAVVYGHPALAAAIPRFVTVRVEPAAQPRIELPSGVQTPFQVVEAAAQMARQAGFTGGFVARVQTEIPLGSGLGSSAAFGVALARAFKPGCDAAEAARLAMFVETVLHGAPSGVDPAACARGGIIFFVRGELPHIEPVRGSAWLVVALTGIARGTHSTVMPLSERRAQQPSRIDPMLARLGELTRLGRGELERGDLARLGTRMDEAHAILRELGVSCPELDTLVGALKASGALGAKLTGAGGGGAAIALARDETDARAMATQTGGFAVQIGAP